MKEKRIELCKLKVSDIQFGLGNPRKISKAKLEELERSFESLGDFGIFLVDENNNIVGGNQRLKVVKKLFGPDAEIDCKRLIGYTEAELRSINIKDNTHAGEWDLDILADWTSDMTIDLGIQTKAINAEERDIKEMELIHYEKYDYVMIVCRSELDYNDLVRKLGIEGAKVKIAKRKINARAIWYDQMKATIVPHESDKEPLENEESGTKDEN